MYEHYRDVNEWAMALRTVAETLKTLKTVAASHELYGKVEERFTDLIELGAVLLKA